VSKKKEDPAITFPARIISDGRITVPEEVRSILALDSGDIVNCTLKKLAGNEETKNKGKKSSQQP